MLSIDPPDRLHDGLHPPPRGGRFSHRRTNHRLTNNRQPTAPRGPPRGPGAPRHRHMYQNPGRGSARSGLNRSPGPIARRPSPSPTVRALLAPPHHQPPSQTTANPPPHETLPEVRALPVTVTCTKTRAGAPPV